MPPGACLAPASEARARRAAEALRQRAPGRYLTCDLARRRRSSSHPADGATAPRPPPWLRPGGFFLPAPACRQMSTVAVALVHARVIRERGVHREIYRCVGKEPVEPPAALGRELRDLIARTAACSEGRFEVPDADAIAPAVPPVRVQLNTAGIHAASVTIHPQPPEPCYLSPRGAQTRGPAAEPAHRLTHSTTGDSNFTRATYGREPGRGKGFSHRVARRPLAVHSRPPLASVWKISVI